MKDSVPRLGGRPAARTTADVQALIAAERGGQPFLIGRRQDGRGVIAAVTPRGVRRVILRISRNGLTRAGGAYRWSDPHRGDLGGRLRRRQW
jgi:hypothetical protein